VTTSKYHVIDTAVQTDKHTHNDVPSLGPVFVGV